MDNVLTGSGMVYYWSASGAYWTYLWARCAALGDVVHVVGQSQLMDAPGQEPSVSILDWNTGNGTAKYWVMRLVLDSVQLGDRLLSTTSSLPASLHAQAFAPAHPRPGTRVALLLINKVFANATVTLPPTASAAPSCTLAAVDASTGLGPPRTAACTHAATVTLAPYATAFVYY